MKNMKWIISCLAFLLAMVGQAQNSDELKMKAAPVDTGKTWKLELELHNPISTQYTAFQMKLDLPEGWTYEDNSLEVGTRLMAHQVDCAKQTDGSLRVVGYSLKNMAIPGESGNLFTFVVRAPENLPSGIYTVSAVDVIMGKRDGSEKTLRDERVRIHHEVPKQKYDLTYMVDDTIYRQLQLHEGDTIPAVPQPEKEGHTFQGWTGLPEVMPAHALTVEATFTVNKYTVTYYLDNVYYARQRLKYGEQIVPPHVDDTAEATFSGWQNVPETMPARDLKIYGETLPTGIANLQSTDLVTVHTLQGVRILHQVTWSEARHRLAKGIYLVNGKLLSIQ